MCALPACGDTIVQTGEECDDGNVVDGDGCEADCTLGGTNTTTGDGTTGGAETTEAPTTEAPTTEAPTTAGDSTGGPLTTGPLTTGPGESGDATDSSGTDGGVSDGGCGCRSDARSGLQLLWALIPLALRRRRRAAA